MTDEIKTEVTKIEVPAKPVETEVTEVEGPVRHADRNTVFVGSKPFMNYVTAVVMQFTTQNSGEVNIKSRGKFISKAVDVAEVVRRRFLSGQIGIHNVGINSESFVNKEGRQVSVSTIDIALKRI